MIDDFAIRPFETIEELRDCVALQEDTWGNGFSERVAPAILKVSQILGGVAAGAYDTDGQLAGFVFGMTGVRGGELVHWSDMLAVRPEYRNSGLGTVLKAYQRGVMLERGVTRMHWTFDPLQSKNAYLNFSKLGIVAPEYERDMYGQTDSPLHRGIGTDRFVALWLLDHPRTERRLSGSERFDAVAVEAAPTVLAEDDSTLQLPVPGVLRLGEEASVVKVSIPADVSDIMHRSMELAVRWREATREAFTHYLDRGYEARELVRGSRTSEYVLYDERISD